VLWERSVVEQRYDAVREVLDGRGVTEVATRYGVSRQSIYTWMGRYRAGGLAGLQDRSHRPTSSPDKTSAQVEAAVCQLRRTHPGWGPQRLGYELERAGVLPVPSRVTIWRILARNGLVDPQRGRRRRRDYRPWERETPMSLWQMDIMGGVWLENGTEAKLVTGIDDHSRYCVVAHLVVQATGRAVCAALVDGLGTWGLPGEVLTDIHPEWVLMEPVGSGRPRRFVGDRRSSVTAAIAIGAAGVDSLPVDRGGGRGPRRRRSGGPVRNLTTPQSGSAAGDL
jgi:transposase